MISLRMRNLKLWYACSTGENSLKVPVPPPKSGAKHRKKSKMQPPPSVQPNYTYDDPGMGRYLDDAYRWNAGRN